MGETFVAVIIYQISKSSRVELLLIIVCACAPTLKPLYDQVQQYKNPRKSHRILPSTRPTYYPVGSDRQMSNVTKGHPLEAVYLRDTTSCEGSMRRIDNLRASF